LPYTNAQAFFTFYEESYNTLDALEVQEIFLRGTDAYGLKKLSAIPPRKIVLFCNGLVAIQQTHFGMEEPSTFCSKILQELKKIGLVVEGYSYMSLNIFLKIHIWWFVCIITSIHSF
jgi:hypothetical protein